MKHVWALIIKFLMVAVISWIVLGLTTAVSFGGIMLISLAVTVVAYLIGDLLILSKTNNITATIVDVGTSLLVIYLFNYFPAYPLIQFFDALLCSVVIGAGEWFFHKYMAAKVLPDRG